MDEVKKYKRVTVENALPYAIKKLETEAEAIGTVHSDLKKLYDENRPHLGQSRDLGVFDLMYAGGLDEFDQLSGAIADYADRMDTIRKLYAEVQEKAILTAMMLLK